MNTTRFTVTKGTDPFALFDDWYKIAESTEINDPDAAALATVGADHMPNVRMVLVRGHDARGFTFFTNKQGKKGQELAQNAKAALCFHWKSCVRQVRVQGLVTPVTDSESDAYFTSRHPRSRRGAIASHQSQPLDDIVTLETAVATLESIYPDDATIPRPPHWGGFRIVPTRIEFWQQGDNRLHDRFVFTRDDDQWAVQRLYP